MKTIYESGRTTAGDMNRSTCIAFNAHGEREREREREGGERERDRDVEVLRRPLLLLRARDSYAKYADADAN